MSIQTTDTVAELREQRERYNSPEMIAARSVARYDLADAVAKLKQNIEIYEHQKEGSGFEESYDKLIANTRKAVELLQSIMGV
jgi:hypothetical protein